MLNKLWMETCAPYIKVKFLIYLFVYTAMAGESTGSQVALVTGGYDHTIKLWQAHSGVCLRTMQHPDSVRFFI